MWTRVHRIGQGFRTLVCSLLVALVGVADIVGSIDISPLVGAFLPNKDAIGMVMVSLALLFGVLRYLTTTGMFEQHPRVEGQIAPEKLDHA